MVEDGGTYYDNSEPPELEVLDETPEHIDFLAHRYVYNFAQSGSDWADHYILIGRAYKASGEIVIEPHHTHLTERESDDYSQADALTQARKRRAK
jgi:hypothetical protein